MTEADSPDAAAEKDRIVGLLRDEWRVFADLLATLTDEQWSAAALPGWDVHDVAAHIVGMERVLNGETQPNRPADVETRDDVRNPIGQFNEGWIDHYREVSHADVMADFADATAARLRALDAMTTGEFEAPARTPIGDATYARFMQVRLFDCWMHEQDIRAAVGAPGHDDGSVAAESLAEVGLAVGYMVGKRASAPDGSAVTIDLTGDIGRAFHVVVDGKAKVVAELPSPATTTVTMRAALFLRLAGGRVDPSTVIDQVTLGGDTELGGRIVSNLAYTI